MQYSFEGDRREGVGQRSVFTHAVVQGLETGEADMDKNGLVSYTELYNYAYDRVIDETPMQKPGMWVFGLEGDVIVANNPYKKKLDDKAVNELKQAESLPTSSKNVTDDAAKIMSTGISPRTDVEKGKLTPVVPKMEGHGYDTQTGKSKEEYEKEQKPTSIFSPKVLIAIVGVIAVIGAVIAFTLFGHVNPPKIESPVVDEKK